MPVEMVATSKLGIDLSILTGKSSSHIFNEHFRDDFSFKLLKCKGKTIYIQG